MVLAEVKQTPAIILISYYKIPLQVLVLFLWCARESVFTLDFFLANSLNRSKDNKVVTTKFMSILCTKFSICYKVQDVFENQTILV